MIMKTAKQMNQLARRHNLTKVQAACYMYWIEDITPPAPGHSLGFFLKVAAFENDNFVDEIAAFAEAIVIRKVDFHTYCKAIQEEVKKC